LRCLWSTQPFHFFFTLLSYGKLVKRCVQVVERHEALDEGARAFGGTWAVEDVERGQASGGQTFG